MKLLKSFCVIAVLLFSAVVARAEELKIVKSFDGVPISYTLNGAGETALVFIHGWSCDSRYWRMQVPYFSKNYQVVAMDLAGHGHSGFGRKKYSTDSFAQDVKAVAQTLSAKRVILIGHSMSGDITARAALLMPGRIDAIIGVDTLQDVAAVFPKKEFEQHISGFRKDFPAHAQAFVRSMFPKTADAVLVDWIAADVSAAPPAVAVSAMEEYMGLYVQGLSAASFEKLTIPVRAVNTDLWPTNPESNRRHMKSFEYKLLKGGGHFPMLETPQEFNTALENTIAELPQPSNR